MFGKTMVRSLLAVTLSASAAAVQAGTINVFQMPAGQVSLQFVTVGDPGNVADTQVMSDGTTGYGAVGYTYQMGKYDVTAAQYCQFLNAVASQSDPYGLYDIGMADTSSTNRGCGITQSGTAGNYSYSVSRPRKLPRQHRFLGRCGPILQLAAKWATGQSFHNGNGSLRVVRHDRPAQLLNVARNPDARYFIPSEDEWYKAAFYKSGGTNAGYWKYATCSDVAPDNLLSATGTNNACYWGTDPVNLLTPVGAFAASPGPYGTYDQAGDLCQWTSTTCNGTGFCDLGSAWGSLPPGMSSANRNSLEPWWDANWVGFRVASVAAVPEPGSIALLLAGAVALGIWKRRVFGWAFV